MVTTDREPVAETLDRLGACLELIPIDPYGDDITVGFFEKDGVITVWSFSQRPGTQERLAQIRDRAVELADLDAVEGQPTQFRFPGGQIYRRPLKFLARQAVEKSPLTPAPTGRIQVKDLKSEMILFTTPTEVDGRWVYTVDGEGEAKRPELRIRATVKGMERYGEMERVGETEVAFPCGSRYDGLVRVLLPYARNVTGTEDMLEAFDSRGQMTTGSLGFSQT